MKRALFINCILFLSHFQLFSQREPSAIPYSVSPGGASAAYSSQWTAFHNPASISTQRGQNKGTASLKYDNHFFTKELSTISASANIYTSYADAGLAISRFGYSLYSETAIGIAIARQFSTRFAAAVQFNYYCISLPNSEGTHGNMVTQIGLITEVLPHFLLGFHTFNPFQTNIKLTAVEKRIPSLMSIGGSYLFHNTVLVIAQIDKEVNNNPQWRVGMEWTPVQYFKLRIGGNGNPFIPTFGTGFFFKKSAIQILFEKHPTLGVNSGCEISYRF